MRRAKAFTLIELLVVIAVIALLMAILLPTLQRVRRQTRAVICRSNLRQWGQMLALYMEDNQGRFPHGHFDAILFLRGSFVGEDEPPGRESLNPMDTRGIACCPMAVKHNGHGPSRSAFEAWETTYAGPPFRCSYGFNEWLLLGPFDPPHTSSKHGTDVFSLSGRANVPALLDSTDPGGLPFDLPSPPRYEGKPIGPWRSFCMNRHDGYVNGLFLDWSVRRIGLKELWTLKWNAKFDTAGPWTRAGGVEPEDWPEWMRSFKDY